MNSLSSLVNSLSTTNSYIPTMAAIKKTVLITGSTRGIGLALATQYTEAGWNVIGTVRASSNTDKVHYAFYVLVALSPFKIITIDTTDETSVAEAARQLDGVAIDLLINNAGTGFLTEIVEPTKELFVKVFEVNVVGPFLVSRALESNLQLAAKTHGSASIVQISSVLGSITSNTVGAFASTFKGQYSYTTTKAALNMMTRSLAMDLRDSNVAVVAVHPGYVNTELTGNLGVLKPADVAAAIASVVDKVAIEDTGKFLNADPTYPNAELPW
ncbi:C-factor [Phytophthora citrophthora]|uniref:C-factor n=1 Tax=Phytophthora citrophthora TaxID=4793 RepID=A0AAD9LRM2_9STRA|nr:C-factor [Phytophthora citrophthora]